jgi:pimeloyl-ACP methyl ester carboxylesterase
MSSMGFVEALGNLALFIFVAIDVGAIYQAVASIADRRKWPPPGRLVDVGGHRLHLLEVGSGGPTVILEAGGGAWSLEWCRVQAEVGKFTRTVSYDRAGYGWSDVGLKNPTSRQVAEELHALLEKAGIAGPYILVGRSLGGLHVHMFAHLYPREVAGVVLVDASHEDEDSRILPQLRAAGERNLYWLSWLRLLAPVGLIRFAGWWEILPRLGTIEKLPAEHQSAARAGIFRSLYCSTLYSEYRHFEESADQVRAAGSLGDLPLAVLTAANHLDPAEYCQDFPIEASRRIWLELQAELVALSSESHQSVLPDCGNYISLERPEAVVAAIRSVYLKARERVGR